MMRCDLAAVTQATSGEQPTTIPCSRYRVTVVSRGKFGRLGLCQPCATGLARGEVSLYFLAGKVVTRELPGDVVVDP